jgi:SAM-dependent methyltransferase
VGSDEENRVLKVFAAAVAALLMLGAAEPPAAPLGVDVMYVPTSHETVAAMLRIGEVRAGDVVYDLGSGDGRIPIAAAKRFGARGLGVDVNPVRIEEARANAKAAGVEHLVEFRREDLFQTDLREATVITLYLLPELNERLKPRLLALKPGTRIVSHAWDMGDWKPEKRRRMRDGFDIYMWRVPERK